MKKWLILSLVIHLLILRIPLSKKEINLIDKTHSTIKVSLSYENHEIAKEIEKKSVTKTFKKIKNEKSQNKISNLDNSNSKVILDTVTEEFTNIKYSDTNSFDAETTLHPFPEKISVKNSPILTDVLSSSKETSDTDLKSENAVVSEPSNSEQKKELTAFSSNESSNFEEKDENLIGEGKIKLVKNNQSLEYRILESPQPIYPYKAQILSIKESIKVTAEFTVDLNGKIKDINLFSEFSKFRKYDFDKAVEKALINYRFTPIFYKNENVEVRFKKFFEFNMK